MRQCIANALYCIGDALSKTWGWRINNFDPFKNEWYPIGAFNWHTYQWLMRWSNRLDANNTIWGQG